MTKGGIRAHTRIFMKEKKNYYMSLYLYLYTGDNASMSILDGHLYTQN